MNYYACEGKSNTAVHLFKVRTYSGGQTILFDAKLMPEAVRKTVRNFRSGGRFVVDFGFKDVVAQVLSLRWTKFINDRGQQVTANTIGELLRIVQKHNVPLAFIRSGVDLCNPLDGDKHSPFITAGDGVLLFESPKWW
jgi:hypothetical protein